MFIVQRSSYLLFLCVIRYGLCLWIKLKKSSFVIEKGKKTLPRSRSTVIGCGYD